MESITALRSSSHHARSHLFALLAEAFRYPDEEQISLIREGVLRKELAQCLALIAPELKAELDISSLASAGSGDDLQL